MSEHVSDWPFPTADKLKDKAYRDLKAVRQEAVRSRILKRFRLRLETKAPTGAGSYTKGIVFLIGEQTSHPELNKYHAPFCSTKGCSGWLNGLLEDAGIPEAQLFWLNALDNDGTPMDLKKFCDELQPREVIALGKVADKLLHKHGIPHKEVAHPQSWKRFKHHQPYPLIDMLKEMTK